MSNKMKAKVNSSWASSGYQLYRSTGKNGIQDNNNKKNTCNTLFIVHLVSSLTVLQISTGERSIHIQCYILHFFRQVKVRD